MTQIIRDAVIYMHEFMGQIYIVERWTLPGGRVENRWSRMPTLVDPSKPAADNVDKRITAREVPKDIRTAARTHFETMDKGNAQ